MLLHSQPVNHPRGYGNAEVSAHSEWGYIGGQAGELGRAGRLSYGERGWRRGHPEHFRALRGKALTKKESPAGKKPAVNLS